MTASVSIVVAMDRNRLIGRAGRLPWHLPADLAHFKRTTLGKPVIMGRRTHESIGRPLPGRVNIVVTRNPGFRARDCLVAPSLDAAIRAAGDAAEAMVIGGADLYREALPRATRIHLTCIEAAFSGDTWFPPFDKEDWRVAARTDHQADERNPVDYAFVTLERLPR